LALILSASAAALILATCMAENPPEVAKQSSPLFAPHRGQANANGLTGNTSGIDEIDLATAAEWHRRPEIDRMARSAKAINAGAISYFPRATTYYLGRHLHGGERSFYNDGVGRPSEEWTLKK
jgi:hypothetical protein